MKSRVKPGQSQLLIPLLIVITSAVVFAANTTFNMINSSFNDSNLSLTGNLLGITNQTYTQTASFPIEVWADTFIEVVLEKKSIKASLILDNKTPVSGEILDFYVNGDLVDSIVTNELGFAILDFKSEISDLKVMFKGSSSLFLNPSEFEMETGLNITEEMENIIVLGLEQGKAEVGKPVEWKKILKIFNEKDTETLIDLSSEIPEESFNISFEEKKDNKWQKILKILGLTLSPNETREFLLRYFTPGPVLYENVLSKYKKFVTINSSISYENVSVYTEIEGFDEKAIRLYWFDNGERIDVTKDPRFNLKFIDLEGDGLIDRLEWVVPHLSEQTFEVSIVILNVQSYPTVGGNWTVRFETVGMEDLTIKAVNGTSWSNIDEENDLKFLEIKCGEQVLEYEWVNDSVFIENYSCNETGYEISKVLTAGKHTLEFRFGDDIKYAYNRAGENYSWGITTALSSSTNISSCRSMGGQSPDKDNMKLQSVSIYVGSSHLNQLRLAVYQGGVLGNASGPEGATLLKDFGVTSGSGTNQWLTLNVDPTDNIYLAKNTPTWIAYKGNDATFTTRYSSSSADAGDFQTWTGRFEGGISSDESVAYPSTYPAPSGNASYWYSIYLNYTIEPRVITISNGTFSMNTSGLVGYWKLDATNETNYTFDYSGYGNDGKLLNFPCNPATCNLTTGRFGQGLKFDGTSGSSGNDRINVPNSTSLNNLRTLTYCAWIYPLDDGEGNMGRIMTKRFSGGNFIFFIRTSGGTPPSENSLAFFIYNTVAGWHQTISDNNTIEMNKWSHVCAVYDDYGDRTADLYINGEEPGYLDHPTLSGVTLASDETVNISIGNDEDLDRTFNGTIDEVQIWNRVLTVDEIKMLYESRVSPGTQTNFSFSESNTGDANVFYDFYRNGTVAAIWHFDERFGNYTFDDTGNNYTGNIVNADWNSSGKYDYAIDFSDTSHYVNITDMPVENTNITIMAWIYPQTLTGDQRTIVAKYNYSEGTFTKRAFLWRVTDTGGLDFFISNGTSQTQKQTAAGVITTNDWQHVAVVYDYNNNHAKMYVNGEFKPNSIVNNTLVKIQDTNIPITIGRWFSNNDAFIGLIDEVRLYKRLLSEEEILCHYGNNCSEAGFWNDTTTLSEGYYYYTARATTGPFLTLPLSTMGDCDILIDNSTIPFTVDQNNTYYCLKENIGKNDQIGIQFASGTQNSTLDCLGYVIESNDNMNAKGVQLSGSEIKNNTIKNCVIRKSGDGIYLNGATNNSLVNNTVYDNSASGITLMSSHNNSLVNNIVYDDSQYGFYISNSNYNNLTNNTAYNNMFGFYISYSNKTNFLDSISYNNSYGIHVAESYESNIIGGSIWNNTYDYYVWDCGTNNNFTNTNFTFTRTIYFRDTISWFNYNNETTGNIWLKTNVSERENITRKLTSWSQNLMQWNDTPNESITARYNITGLEINTDYNVYNNSILAYELTTDGSGNNMR